MSNETTLDTKLVEVSFSSSKTVQTGSRDDRQYHKKNVTVVVSSPENIPGHATTLFQMNNAVLDEAFRAEGIDPSFAPAQNRVTEAGVGRRGQNLERKQERRELDPPTPPEMKTDELINKTPEEFAAARDHAHERVKANPEEFAKVEAILKRLETEGITVKSVAHINYLRQQKNLEYIEFKRLKEWADVLQLPEKISKKEETIDIKVLIKDYDINSIKHAGYLRYHKNLSFQEYGAIKDAHQKNGDTIFVLTT